MHRGPPSVQQLVGHVVSQTFEATCPHDGVAVQQRVDALVEAEADMCEMVEAVDPDELGEGSGLTGRKEGHPEQHRADVEEVLDAIDAHVEVALHRVAVDSADGEPVENGSALTEQGTGQKVPVQPTVLNLSEEGSDVPGTTVRSGKWDLGHVRGEKSGRRCADLLQVAFVELLAAFLGLAQLCMILPLVFVGRPARTGRLAGGWGRDHLSGGRQEQQPKE